MKKQPKKLTLNKETLRDLTARNASEVKGGRGKTKWCGYTVKCNPNPHTHACYTRICYTGAYCP